MIVNYTDSGWQIITQRAHGLLAAQICAHWKKENQPKRWMETLIATAEHDDVFNELENDDLLTENGGPVNYAMTSFNRHHAEHLLDMAMTKSRYIALLTARHLEFVHGSDPLGHLYCKELKKKQALWLKEANTTLEEIDASYSLLQFSDAFSLLICQGMIPPEQRKIEISDGPDGKPYVFYCDRPDSLIVSDWPFNVPEFTINYESRTLEQLVFKDVEAFRKAVRQSAVTFHELSLHKA